MDEKQKVYNKLDSMGIDYQKEDHKPVFTIEELTELGFYEKGQVCKNLFLRDEKGRRHFLVVAPGHKDIDLKILRKKIGSTRLSFGSDERLWNCFKVKTGSVSPFGVINDDENRVEVIFLKDLVSEKKLGFHPNDNSATVWIGFEDIKRVVESCGNQVTIVSMEG